VAFRALQITLGRTAAQRIEQEGWQADHFSLVVGASGGPKWFILSHLDRFLFGDFLQRGTTSLTTLGSSIGAWRKAAVEAAGGYKQSGFGGRDNSVHAHDQYTQLKTIWIDLSDDDDQSVD